MAKMIVNAVVSDGQFSRMSSTYDNLKASLGIIGETVQTMVKSTCWCIFWTVTLRNKTIVFKIKRLFASLS